MDKRRVQAILRVEQAREKEDRALTEYGEINQADITLLTDIFLPGDTNKTWKP